MVRYDYDIFFIQTEAMKICELQSSFNAYETLYDSLASRGLKLRCQKFTMKLPTYSFKVFKNNIDFQLVPSNMHWFNADEWAIQAFKNHFIAELCSVNPDLPLKLWDMLLNQETTTLNLMKISRIYLNIFSHKELFGIFNFNCTPFAPPGTRVLVHEML